MIMLSEESDRSVVVFIGGYLDSILMDKITFAFPVPRTDAQLTEAFRFEGPLGTFSSRIEIAFLFGLIDEKAHRQLSLIRELRNACAHSIRRISFDTPELIEVARQLLTVHGYGLEYIPQLVGKGLRLAFIAETLLLANIVESATVQDGFKQHLVAWIPQERHSSE